MANINIFDEMERTMNKLKVAIIGTGMIANAAHIPAWKDLADQVQIVAVADDREQAARETARRHGIPNHYTDYQKMLEAEKPDIVSVCTPNRFHKPAAIAALRAGAHVLCEKPLSASAADAKEMYDEARACGKLLCANQTMRFDPNVLAAKAFYDAGAVGRPYFVEANIIRRRGIPKWGFFHIAEYNAAGPGFDIGVHILDAILWILGAPKVLAVSGQTYRELGDQNEGLLESLSESGAPAGVFTPRPYDCSEFDVEDFAAGFVRLEGGITLSLKASWALNAPEESGVSYISGTKGGVMLLPKAQLITNMAGYQVDVTPRIPAPRDVHFEDHYHATSHFLKVIAGEAELLVKEDEVLNVLRVLDALYQSGREGREITVL